MYLYKCIYIYIYTFIFTSILFIMQYITVELKLWNPLFTYIHTYIYLLIYSCIYLLIDLFTYLFTYLFIFKIISIQSRYIAIVGNPYEAGGVPEGFQLNSDVLPPEDLTMNLTMWWCDWRQWRSVAHGDPY